MPLFHSNAAVAGYTAPMAAGATTVLRRRFSASGFLPDVRKYGVTFFNYVGKPLTYILETPAQPDDADSTLRIGFGNEAAPLDIDRFAQRFGCYVVDGYGSTEGGINMSKTDDTPPGSLGVPVPGFRAEIVDPDTGIECPRAQFDEHGRLLNAEEAIGEMVNPDGAGSFEGYYNNPEANAERMLGGKYRIGRPRLPRRRRVLLLRGPQLRLAARRRRELRGRAGRAGHLPPSRRRAGRGVRGAVGRSRRRGDGRDAPARRHDVRPGRVRRVPAGAVGPFAEVDARASCASRTGFRRPRRRRC